MPPMRFSNEAFGPLVAAMTEDAHKVADALMVSPVRYTVLAGGASPMPWGQVARTTSDLSPTASLTVLPSAGHYVWHEAPGCVRHALSVLARHPPA